MMRPFPSFPTARFRRTGGFSLVEVTLALGIVTFALVGAIGVLPTALASSRRSFNENRAAAIADTLFAGFRSEPFQAVRYLDEQFDQDGHSQANPKVAPLDLNASTQVNALTTTVPSGGVRLYATILDVGTSAGTTSDPLLPLSVQRHIRFANTLSTGADYQVTMYFNNQPNGTVITPQPGTANAMPIIPAEANEVKLVIVPVSRPQDKLQFVSTVANRVN